MSDQIKVLKISGGEEIIARIREEDEYILLNKPCKIMPISESQIACIPWIMIGKSETVKIGKQHIIVIVEAKDEVQNIYNEKTGDGIVTPPKGIALP